MAITGGCLCKAVRYRIAAAAPIAVRTCWCRLCQYIATGNATVNTAFFSKDFTLESGAMGEYRSVADSGNKMCRKFCVKCGTHVFSEAEARPHLIFVRAGSLDDSEIAAPQATIWTKAAPSWACISETLPRFEGQPPPVA